MHGVARELDEAGVPSPRVDAELLVADVLGVSRSELYASDRLLEDAEVVRLRELVASRRAREPLAYVLGEWGFRRLVLAVDARALVPRPETEVVVERCLVYLQGLESPRVLDVGTGSGAIALAIADEHRGARVVAVDRDAGALALARENLERTGLGRRVELRRGDLLDGAGRALRPGRLQPAVRVPGGVRLAPARDPTLRAVRARSSATASGSSVARAACGVLPPGGRLVLECGDGQAAEVAEPALRPSATTGVRCTPDLAGRDRAVEAHRP